jgi:Calcineurin-like phosphoesterase/Secretion system C-terminal sorting domain/Purple acid Phosphatase, N-terminal domain
MKPSHFTLRVSLIIFLATLVHNQSFSQVTRGAYLQMGNQTSITIRWTTTVASNSRVRISAGGGAYASGGLYATIIDDATSTTDHKVTVNGLTADTKYFYSIGTSAAVQQESANNFFTTAPPANTTRKIRIAAFGDCGREGGTATNQTNSYNGYQTFLSNNSIDAADAWLLLGDNAYNVGNSTEYTSSFFTPYDGSTKQILRNHKLYPSPGNHDYNNAGITGTANRRARTWHYFSCFTTPQNAECGGVASTKPNYYSFDIGNIHFLSLDSWGLEQTDGDSWMGSVSATTVMKNWIAADLAANTKKWVVAYWHHPPYTKGSHNSDTEPELVQIRESINVFLETKGVDLVISGHSHAYERSYLLRNFTGVGVTWSSFLAGTHAANSSSAKWDGAVGSAPYKYNSTNALNPVTPLNHGTVYVVAGNSGANNGSTTNFGAYAMPYATTNAGIFYLEVEDNRLDGRMINHTTGTTFEKFTIIKDGGNKSTTYNIVLGQSQLLNASWPNSNGTYTWTGSGASGTNRSVSVTPASIGTYNYTVADNTANSGLLDNITLNVSTTLPVTFTNFTVQKSGMGAVINWGVSDISSHNYFSIERSVDGANFTEIGKNTENINGQTSHSFTFNDLQLPSSPILYYRIKQCDMNGSCRYTDVKSIRAGIKDGGIVLYPVPAQDVVNMVYTSNSTGKIRISIADQYGRKVLTETRNATAGRNDFQVAISTLKPGNYIVTVTDGKGKWTEKVIKL